jgi:Fe2+ or Zn2+ uptake regulation protein
MSTAVKRPTSARRRIYQALVEQPGRHWTVRTLTDALAMHASVKETAVRDTINLLLSLRLVELVPHQRATTIVLTSVGERALTVALRRCHPRQRS